MKFNCVFALCATTMVVGVMAPPVVATIRHVDDSAAPGGDGLAWTTAYDNLQTALGAASAGDEIRVGQGSYRPAGPGGARTATFEIANGLTLRGGYAGVGAADPDARDIVVFASILSGDLAGNDGAEGSFLNNSDNCFHVASITTASASCTIDGFVITAGNADGAGGSGTDIGGALNCGFQAAPNVTSCSFRFNSANALGGAVRTSQGADSHFTDCTFIGNRVATGASNRGGGAAAVGSGGPYTFTNCTFTSNTSLGNGGALFTFGGQSTLTITGCNFTGNSAPGVGANTGIGGAVNTGVSPPGGATITDCTFRQNSAGLGGGLFDGGTATLTRCRFILNSASWTMSSGGFGGGIFSNGTETAVNCSFFGNTADRGALIAGASGGGAVTQNSSGALGIVRYVNCLFSGNQVMGTGGVVGGAIATSCGGQKQIINCTFSHNSSTGSAGGAPGATCINFTGCIFNGNTPSDLSGAPTITFSCAQSLFAGTGNILAAPGFVDADGADNMFGTEDDNLQLSVASPCIDKGLNSAVPITVTTDLAGHRRFIDDPATADCPVAPGMCGTAPIVDMGAYEFQPAPAIVGDLNGDGVVNSLDLGILLSSWSIPATAPGCGGAMPCPADLNGDGFVNSLDLGILLSHWTL